MLWPKQAFQRLCHRSRDQGEVDRCASRHGRHPDSNPDTAACIRRHARGKLLQTAAHLFRSKGYERTTVRDLASAVGIQSGSIFHHFKSKDEMTEIAAIPPLQTLRGMFVNVVNSPIQGLAIALNQIAEKKA